jgi:hypothetical protein
MTTSLRFPLGELLDEDACYRWLLTQLHPDGLRCPEDHELPVDQAPHTRHRAPIVEYRCRRCGCVFNLFTSTALKGIRYSCRVIVQMLYGFLTGVTTLRLAEELQRNRGNLLQWRHAVQALFAERFPPLPS